MTSHTATPRGMMKGSVVIVEPDQPLDAEPLDV